MAVQSGKTIEDVIKQAVEAAAQAAGVPLAVRPPTREIDIAGARAIARRIKEGPVLARRAPQEILDQAWGRDSGHR